MQPKRRTTRRRRAVWLAPFLVLAGALFAPSAQASAAPVSITRRNLSQFSQLRSRDPFVCYTVHGRAPQLGEINGRVLKAGLEWTRSGPSTIARSINGLERTARRLQRGGRRNARELRRTRAAIAKLRSRLALATILDEECRLGPDRPEFLGDQNSLAPYREALTRNEVRHLLDRVAFGGSPELEQIGLNGGLSALVSALVDGVTTPQEETQLQQDALFWAGRNFYYETDDPDYANIRIWTTEAAQAGQIYRFVFSRNPLHEWMLQLLSAHFATNLDAIGFSYSRFYHGGIHDHWDLLRTHAVGNLADLAHQLFFDPAMNFWLDNKDNHAGDPNQNYGRELLELFLLGAIDPITGMPNYGEESVVASTAFVSGFEEAGKTDPETGETVVAIDYNAELHDSGAYTIFPGHTGAQLTATLTPDAVVDQVLYHHPGSPRYLAERFAGQMLYPGLPEPIVEALAQELLHDHYELNPFLKRVLRSSAMFSSRARGACIDAPLEDAVRLARHLLRTPLSKAPEQLDRGQWLLATIANRAGAAGQLLFEPPSVFGWKGSCNINRAGSVASGEGWITAQRVLNRSRGCLDFMNVLTDGGFDYVQALSLTAGMTPGLVTDTIARQLFNLRLTDQQRSLLAGFLVRERSDEGEEYEVEMDLTDGDYVARKVPRLVCLLNDMLDANSN